MKYFVLGAFCVGLLPLRHRARSTAPPARPTSSTSPRSSSTTVLAETGLLLAGLALLLVGFAFKVAAVPFHFWTPDVYQGAPSPSVAWMASGVKVAGFAGLLRVFYLALRHLPSSTGSRSCSRSPRSRMVVGSVLAVVQTDVKRMLAYSLDQPRRLRPRRRAGRQRRRASQAALFYLAAYTFMVAGSFGDRHGRQPQGRRRQQPRRLPRPRRRDRPVLALAFAVFLFAQAGVPLTSGFFAKFYVITAAVDAGSTWLAIIAMLTAVDRRVPLPADHRVDVHVGRRRRRAAAPSRSRSPPAWPSVPAAVVTLGVGLFPAPSPARPRTPPPPSSSSRSRTRRRPRPTPAP